MKKENKREYTKQKDRFLVSLHLKWDEKSVLENEMKKEEWENISGYIRYRLFGMDPTKKIRKQIAEKEPEDLVNILKNAVLELAAKADYYRFRYDKDMSQLYREEGVDIKKWIEATNKWRRTIDNDFMEVFSTIRQIAKVLELDEYFHMPSRDMHLDNEHPSQEEIDKMAEQLRIEKIALGYGDEL